MMLWAVLAFSALMTSAVLAWPLVKHRKASPPRIDYDLAVYTAQLAEIEKDRERGFLGEKDATAARLEIHRRLLAADMPENKPANNNTKRTRTVVSRIAAAVIILSLLPGASFGIYHYIGASQMATTFQGASAQNMYLSAYEKNGNKYLGKGQYDLAVQSYKQALEINADNEQVWSSLGESLALLNHGQISNDARIAFAHAYQLAPHDPKAEFSLAVASAQDGDYHKAVAILRDLKQSSPTNAAWNPTVDQEISRLAKKGGLNASNIPPAPPTEDINRLLRK